MNKNKNKPENKPPLEIINEEPKSFIMNEPILKNDVNHNSEIDDEHNKTIKMERSSVKLNHNLGVITSIIPEHKLLNATEDDVMFQSNIKRLLNQKIGNHISQTFCDRFCMTTINCVKLYKSREQFLKVSKPTNVFPLNGIKAVKPFYLKGNKKLHFFVLELSDLNNKTGI
jgi:hypothetical protein